jgi:hypothetical protein
MVLPPDGECVVAQTVKHVGDAEVTVFARSARSWGLLSLVGDVRVTGRH